MKNTLSKRDEDTLNFIKVFMLEYNVTPTIRDICEGLNISSVASAYNHFKKLVDQGYIVPFDNNTNRTTRYTVKGMKIVEDRRRVKKTTERTNRSC